MDKRKKSLRIKKDIRKIKGSVTKKEMEKENENISFSVPDLKNYLDYKAYLAIGNNTWNIFIQYSFVPIFKGKFLQNKNSAEAYNVNIGLIFYIL